MAQLKEQTRIKAETEEAKRNESLAEPPSEILSGEAAQRLLETNDDKDDLVEHQEFDVLHARPSSSNADPVASDNAAGEEVESASNSDEESDEKGFGKASIDTPQSLIEDLQALLSKLKSRHAELDEKAASKQDSVLAKSEIAAKDSALRARLQHLSMLESKQRYAKTLISCLRAKLAQLRLGATDAQSLWDDVKDDFRHPRKILQSLSSVGAEHRDHLAEIATLTSPFVASELIFCGVESSQNVVEKYLVENLNYNAMLAELTSDPQAARDLVRAVADSARRIVQEITPSESAI
jgi:hypothetical protein